MNKFGKAGSVKQNAAAGLGFFQEHWALIEFRNDVGNDKPTM